MKNFTCWLLLCHYGLCFGSYTAGDTYADAEDPIVYCDGCNLSTHASCYGCPLHKGVPEGDWYCHVCREVLRKNPQRQGKDVFERGDTFLCRSAPKIDSWYIMFSSFLYSTLEYNLEYSCDAWFVVCRKSGESMRCALCPSNQGALKRTTDWQLCHLSCAFFIPEAFFHNSEAREYIDILSVPKRRFQCKCYICDKSIGACIECKQQFFLNS